MKGNSYRVLVMVLVLVSSVVLAPMVSPQFERVSPVGDAEAVAPLVVVGAGIVSLASGGAVGYAVNDWLSVDTGLTQEQWTDYGQTSALEIREDQREVVDQELQTMDKSAYNAALSEAKIRWVSEVNNGSSLGTSYRAGVEGFDDVISSYQKIALVNGYEGQINALKNTNAAYLAYYNEAADNESVNYESRTIDGKETIVAVDSNGTLVKQTSSHINLVDSKADNVNLRLYENGSDVTVNATLMNGSQVEIETFSHSAGGDFKAFDPSDDSDYDFNNHAGYAGEIKVDGTVAIDLRLDSYSWKKLFNHYDSVKEDGMNNLGERDNGFLYDAYQKYYAGAIESNTILTPYDYQRMSMDRDNVGSLSWYNTQMLVGGFGGNSTSSVVMELNDGTTISGNLFTRATPPTTGTNGSAEWQVDTSYNATNLSHPVYMTTTTTVTDEDGNERQQGRMVQINGEFVITKAVDATTGEEYDSFSHQDYSMDTTNVSDLRDEMEQLRNTIEDLEDEQDSAGGGGGSIIPDGRIVGNDLLVLGGIVLAISYLARRED